MDYELQRVGKMGGVTDDFGVEWWIIYTVSVEVVDPMGCKRLWISVSHISHYRP